MSNSNEPLRPQPPLLTVTLDSNPDSNEGGGSFVDIIVDPPSMERKEPSALHIALEQQVQQQQQQATESKEKLLNEVEEQPQRDHSSAALVLPTSTPTPTSLQPTNTGTGSKLESPSPVTPTASSSLAVPIVSELRRPSTNSSTFSSSFTSTSSTHAFLTTPSTSLDPEDTATGDHTHSKSSAADSHQASSSASAAVAISTPDTDAGNNKSSDAEHIMVKNMARLDIMTITPEKYYSLVEKSTHILAALGGLNGIAKDTGTDLKRGLPDDTSPEFAEEYRLRREKYGVNSVPPAPVSPIWEIMLEALSDRTMIVLCIAATVSLAIGIYEAVTSPNDPEKKTAYVDGIAILVAVVAVVTVSSVNDYNKSLQFQKLNAVKNNFNVNVIRNGIEKSIPVQDVVVGDLLELSTGDVLCADGIFVSGHDVRCDESSITGESNPMPKKSGGDVFMLSGSKVLEGVCIMLVTGVGVNSMNGKILLELRTESEETPLQIKLGVLAENIGKVGSVVAGVLFIVLFIIYFAHDYRLADPKPSGVESFQSIVNIVIAAVTIVVVAVPEGLPLAVTFALSYSCTKMLQDNNFVRVLAACETMGGATTICSDKTGTLTENKMSVARGFFGDTLNLDVDNIDSFKDAISHDLLLHIVENLNINSTAHEVLNDEKHEKVFVGSRTEVALLNLTVKLGFPYEPMRSKANIVRLFPFSSDRKCMSVVIEEAASKDSNLNPNKPLRLFTKGAAEIIFSQCSHEMTESGEIRPLTEQRCQIVNDKIQEYASKALRTICVAFKDIARDECEAQNLETGLIFLGVLGMRDPVRAEVPGAVEACKRAGIVVRMVTGDNINTARAIAQDCGILTKTGIVMEGSVFRRLTSRQMDMIVPNLQVLARSSPLDKQILVKKLKELGETVAVTGDGTNDGPALKASDVGFSMGIAGTDVAKEASDIVLLDDNFASLVKAVMWGRNVEDAVRKFLQFQLTVNIVAVTVAFISAISDPQSQSVLSATQLLWVNLIMDTLGALALATEVPTPALLDREPRSKDDPLIDFEMWRLIVLQSVYQIFICLGLYYAGPSIFNLNDQLNSSDDTVRLDARSLMSAIVFNSFVFMQLFNEINCRRLDSKFNIFSNILKNRPFLIILFSTAIIQVLIVEFGGTAFKTRSLGPKYWGICIALGASCLLVAVIAKLIPNFLPNKEPEPTQIISREQWMWHRAIGSVKTQIKVVDAFQTYQKSDSV